MTGPTTRKVIEFWNLLALVEDYDAPFRPGFDVGRDHDAWRDELRQVLPPPPADVLDLGSGTGFLSLLMAEMGHRVRGIDLADNMLTLARSKARAAGLDVVFEKSDAHDPAGAAGSVDAVTSRHLFWTLESPATLLRSALRLLRPGGIVVVIDGAWFASGWDPGPSKDKGWYQRWVEVYSDDLRAELPLLEANGADDVVQMAVEAGFVDVKAGRLTHVELMFETTVGIREPEGRRFVMTARKPAA